MFTRIAFLSVALTSLSAFALTLPPRMAQESRDDSSLQPLAIALGRDVTNEERALIRTAQRQMEVYNSAPQKAAVLFGWEMRTMACAVAQANYYLARAGGIGCIDLALSEEFGTRYLLGGAQMSSDMGSLEGGVGLLVYVGPAKMKPFVGNYAVGGGMFSIPLPFLKVGPDTKYATNLDNQFLVFIGGNVGVTGNPSPIRLSGGALTVQKIDWLGWARGQSK